MRSTRPAPLLIAEDSADDLFLLTRLLKKAGVSNPLYIVSDGEEAIELCKRVLRGDEMTQRPAAALLDIKMPKVDGLELLAWIRRQPALDQLPVIMLSSSCEPRDVTQAAQLGAQYFFTKYPSELTMARVLEAAARFASSGNHRRVHHVPSNLLPETDGPLR